MTGYFSTQEGYKHDYRNKNNNIIMNKIQLFSEKTTYASPSSKLIILQGSQCLMDSRYQDQYNTEIIGEEGDEYDL